MKELTYETADLIKDDLRAVAGLVIFGSPLVFLQTIPWITVSLGAVTAVFLLFLGKCAIRHRTFVTVSDTTIGIRALKSTEIEWAAVSHVVLKYYSPRRRSGQGWMQLTVSDGAGKIVIESGLQGFEGIVRRAARIIGQNGLDVSASTRTNSRAMKIDLPGMEENA